MAKRIFRIEAGRYGGETVIGEVDKEFVEQFIDEGEGELIEHLTSTCLLYTSPSPRD